jgi:hypothetical protein
MQGHRVQGQYMGTHSHFLPLLRPLCPRRGARPLTLPCGANQGSCTSLLVTSQPPHPACSVPQAKPSAAVPGLALTADGPEAAAGYGAVGGQAAGDGAAASQGDPRQQA